MSVPVLGLALVGGHLGTFRERQKTACSRCHDWNFPENDLKRMEETVLVQALTTLVSAAPGSSGRGGPCTVCTCFSCGHVESPGAESPPRRSANPACVPHD